MKKLFTSVIRLCIFLVLVSLGEAFSQKIPFQGQLVENDVPVNGSRNFVFGISGSPWTETHTNVQISNGLYSVVLGSLVPLPADLFSLSDVRQLNITVGNLVLTPINIYASLASSTMSLVVDAAPDGKDLANFNLSGQGTAGKLYRALSGTSSVVNGINAGVSGYGLSGASTTNNVYGVFGRATGIGSGQHRGVYGEAASPVNSNNAHYGLYGAAVGNGIGSHFGLFATSQAAPPGRLFNYGALTSADGVGRNNIGLRGLATGVGDGSTGFNAGSYNNGVQGFARGNSWGNTGVYGWVYNDPTTGLGAGVDNNGVVGRSEVNDGTNTVNNTGIRGDAKGPGINKGVVGMASGGAQNWAGWFDGDVRVTGNLVFNSNTGVSSLSYPFVNNITTPTGTNDLIKITYDNSEVKRMLRLENLNPANGGSTVSILQKGIGIAGFFQANHDQGDAGTALYGTTNSNRGGAVAPVGVYGESTGTGSLAAAFRINNTGNNYAAVYTETNGTGPALHVNNISDVTTGPVAIFTYKGTPATIIEKNGKLTYSSAQLNGDATNGIRMYGKFDNGSSHISLDGGANHIFLWGNGNIDATGTVTAVTLTQTSDRKLKTNIRELQSPLKNLLKLRGVSYNWVDKTKSANTQIGLIAQEVEQVYPEFVHTNELGIKSVNYSQMVAVLIESIKELNQAVEKLQGENTNLKAELSKVQSNAKKIQELEDNMNTLLSIMKSKGSSTDAEPVHVTDQRK